MTKQTDHGLNRESFEASLQKLLNQGKSASADQAKQRRTLGILAALSGGPDSVALLHLLVAVSKLSRLRIRAAHVNYGLRGRESDLDQKFCQKLCDNLGVELITKKVKLKSTSGVIGKRSGNIQSLAREIRYAHFDSVCQTHDLSLIATGHNQSDNVETVLMNLSRGTGTFGLGGIKSRSGRVIRPLMDFTREQILEYLKKQKLQFRTDSSNSENKYTRNKVRNQLLPVLMKTLGAAAMSNISRSASLLSEHEQYLRVVAGEILGKHSQLTPGGKIVIDLNEFRKYHVLIQRIVIALCYEKLTGSLNDFERAATERVFGILESAGARVDLKKGIFAEIAGEKLFIYRENRPMKPKKLKPSGTTKLEELGVELKSATLKTKSIDMKSLGRGKNRRVFLDSDAVKLPLVVRLMQSGDRFQPLGMRVAKRLSDFFIDRKVARPLREETPLLVAGSEIVWVVGYEISENARVKRTTKEVVEMEVVVST